MSTIKPRLTKDDFIKPYKHTINYGLGMLKMTYVLDNYDLDFDVYLPTKNKNLQRGFVWTLEQKQNLIIAILKNMNIGNVTVLQLNKKSNKDDLTCFQILDGKQRLSTIISYMNNEFPIIVKDTKYFYNDLPKELRDDINFYPLKWDTHYEHWDKEMSDELKITIFENLNFLCTPQDIEHIKDLKS